MGEYISTYHWLLRGPKLYLYLNLVGLFSPILGWVWQSNALDWHGTAVDYTFVQNELNFWINNSSNGHQNRVSWPHLPIVWHQERPTWIMLKSRWFMKLFRGRSFEFRGREDVRWFSEVLFVSETPIGREIVGHIYQPIICVVTRPVIPLKGSSVAEQ